MQAQKKTKPVQKKKPSSSVVNDIINMIKDTQLVADKKLEEISKLCIDKACRIKV